MKKFLFGGMLVVILTFGFLFVSCDNGTTEEPAPVTTKFEGTWEMREGFGFIFSGSNVTQYGIENGQNWTNPGTFTFTDTTITFNTEWNTWTMGYTLTATYLELTRLAGDTDNWAGRFTKK